MNRVAACAFAVLFLAGCAAEPSEETVRKVLTDHFKGRGYRVISMELGTIRPITLGEKRYMGTRGYEVPVKSISLEVSADTGSRGAPGNA